MNTRTYNLKTAILKLKKLIIVISLLAPLAFSGTSFAGITCVGGSITSGASNNAKYCCGSGKNAVETSINLGCQGKGQALADMLFAIIRLLSDGVGLIVIASLIVAGIQFTSSRGDPQAAANAIKRIESNVIALVIFFFAYAIINYLIPGQVL